MKNSITMTILFLFSIMIAATVFAGEGANMKIFSQSFPNDKFIPQKYTCEGDDVNPPLTIEGIPEKTKSLALIVDDPDAPGGTWVHWVVFNIKVKDTIDEDSVPGMQGINDFKEKDYGGPCPPSGIHHYYFKIYALDTKLDLKEGIKKQDLEKAMEGHVLDQTELVGLYKKVY